GDVVGLGGGGGGGGGGEEVAAAAARRLEPRRRPAAHRTVGLGTRGARHGTGLARGARCRAAARGADPRPRDRRADGAGRGGADEAAALAHDRRARPGGRGAPRRAGLRLDDPVARRPRGHSRLSREACGALADESRHRHAGAGALPQAMKTLGAFLDVAAARAPEREAVSWAERDTVSERATWAELRAASRLAARKLLGLGVGKGTRVGLLCPNRPEWLPIAFGALRLGAVLVPFSTLWKRDEIAYGLVHGDVQVLLARAGFLRRDYLADLKALLPELDRTAPGRLANPAIPALRRVVLLEPGSRPRRRAP